MRVYNSDGSKAEVPWFTTRETAGLGKYSEDTLTWNLNHRSLSWEKALGLFHLGMTNTYLK